MKITPLAVGVDSLTVSIPLDYCENLPTQLTATILEVDAETMEVYEQRNNGKPVVDNDCDIKLRMWIENHFGSRILSFTLHSKMLEAQMYDRHKRRLRSINWTTIERCMDYINCRTGLHIPTSTLEKYARVRDVDFHVDFSEITPLWNRRARLQTDPTKSVYYDKKKNVLDKTRITGWEYSKRETATNTNPFVKYYTKLLEMEARNPEFLATHMPEFNLPNYRRLEATVKNQKHFSYLVDRRILPAQFDSQITLEKVFSLSEKAIKRVVDYMLCQQIGESLMMARDLEDLPPIDIKSSDYMLGLMTYELLRSGHSLKTVIGLFDKCEIGKPASRSVAKSRLKSRITKGLEAVQRYEKIRNLRVTTHDAFLPPKRPKNAS